MNKRVKLFAIPFGVFFVSLLLVLSLVYSKKTTILDGCYQNFCVGNEPLRSLNKDSNNNLDVYLLTKEGKFKESKLSNLTVKNLRSFDMIYLGHSGVFTNKNYTLFIQNETIEKIDVEIRGKLYLDP